MKTRLKLFRAGLCYAVALGLGSSFHLATAAEFSDANWISIGGSLPGATGLNGSVSALTVSGSDLYAGGTFTTAGGSAANYIAKWNGSWSALGSGIAEPEPGPVFFPFGVSALAVSGSDLYAGGRFTTAGGTTVNSIAKWNGSSWSALGSGVSGAVYALAMSGNYVYAGGSFTTASSITVNNIAKWDGSSWSALGSGMGGGHPIYGYSVRALAVLGSDLYAGGEFTEAGGNPAFYIARWNGTNWSAVGFSHNYVSALAVSGTNLYAAGGFNYVLKWDGNIWTELFPGLSQFGSVSALVVSGSDLYAGGYFTTAGGSPASNIARWNGNSWSALGSGLNGGVGALAVSGSDLFAGGSFTTAGGKVSPYIARAYLLTLPTLSILRSSVPQGGIEVSWPSADSAGFALEQAGTLTAPANWLTNSASVTDDGTNKSVTLPATNSSQFFRLRRR